MDVRALSEVLGLTRLPDHFHTFLFSLVGFTLVQQVFAPVLLNYYFPNAYTRQTRKVKSAWLTHAVSQVHACVIVVLAWRCLGLESVNENRVFGWHERIGTLHAVTCGYFCWDVADAIVNYTDLGFVAHGMAAILIYAGTFRPFVAFYACRCLFWEVSTIFLNLHWFLDKTGRTGGTFQLVNGIMLISAFFGVRLCWGGQITYEHLWALYQHRNELPWVFIPIYGGGNIMLQGLNVFWFSKMINALRKRFPKDTKVEVPNGKMHRAD